MCKLFYDWFWQRCVKSKGEVLVLIKQVNSAADCREVPSVPTTRLKMCQALWNWQHHAYNSYLIQELFGPDDRRGAFTAEMHNIEQCVEWLWPAVRTGDTVSPTALSSIRWYQTRHDSECLMMFGSYGPPPHIINTQRKPSIQFALTLI